MGRPDVTGTVTPQRTLAEKIAWAKKHPTPLSEEQCRQLDEAFAPREIDESKLTEEHRRELDYWKSVPVTPPPERPGFERAMPNHPGLKPNLPLRIRARVRPLIRRARVRFRTSRRRSSRTSGSRNDGSPRKSSDEDDPDDLDVVVDAGVLA
jgi:hypothetical protein